MNFVPIYRRHFAIGNALHRDQSSLCVLSMFGSVGKFTLSTKFNFLSSYPLAIGERFIFGQVWVIWVNSYVVSLRYS